MSTIIRGQFPDLSMEINRLLADMRNPAVRAAFALAPSAALITEARREASHRADRPALAVAECAAEAAASTAVEGVTAAVGVVNPKYPMVG